MAAVIRGNDAVVEINSKGQATFGISDFSVSFSRGTNEQALLGAEGNEFYEGSLSIDGSYTCCKFGGSGNCDALAGLVSGSIISVSGSVSGSTLEWYFTSCQVTRFDITGGNKDTITEASIDWIVLDPYNVTYPSGGKITD
jgi:hypothetical protein